MICVLTEIDRGQWQSFCNHQLFLFSVCLTFMINAREHKIVYLGKSERRRCGKGDNEAFRLLNKDQQHKTIWQLFYNNIQVCARQIPIL